MSSEPSFRWLHLTDLHIGSGNQSQEVAIQSLLDSARKFAGGRPFDAVLLTGDLAFSGKSSEYEALHDALIAPMREDPLWKNSILIATPGNHDLDCAVELPISWSTIGPSKQSKFFFDGPDGQSTRGSRARAFAEYTRFTESSSILSVDPMAAPAKTFSINAGTTTIHFVSVVTAYFSHFDVTDRLKAPAPLLPIRAAFNSIPEGDRIIVIGHHPPDWFTDETARQLRSLIVDRNAIYLHGHLHQVLANFGQKGLYSLGFGAAYQANLEAAPKPYYRNSFTICELTDALHVAAVSWDSEHGRWQADNQLQVDFYQQSDLLSTGYVLSLPTTLIAKRPNAIASIASALRSDLTVDNSIWMAEDAQKRWMVLLTLIGEIRYPESAYSYTPAPLPSGHSQFRVQDKDGKHLVRAVSSHGDIFTPDQIQSLNTELDRQDFDSVLVVTLGELSSDARILAAQLSNRKQFRVIERADLLSSVVQRLPAPLVHALRNLAVPHGLHACLIFTNDDVALLLHDRAPETWFNVLSANGQSPRESSDIVAKLRKEQPSRQTLRYGFPIGMFGQSDALQREPLPFDRDAYLRMSYEYFDNVKYAPLAALGFRFTTASLSTYYVEQSAQIGGDSKQSLALRRAVSEHLDSLDLPKAQREQLETQLNSRHGLAATTEVAVARKLYQRHNNILVLGDPGSGKTCFVKHEILAYCDQSKSGEVNWYSRHTPIYLSLAEAARLLDDESDILKACETVAARRGILLPVQIIENALAEGKAAFFFDGLDEVGYLDKRIALLTQIDALVSQYAPRGCRFALTSRPAAIQPVDIPEGLTYLQLNGLTDQEIRVLATRVLANRLGESETDRLNGDESRLIDRLMADTRIKPDIARIARNPLLLTLLVLIYANSGAVSARRHTIYTQAIKTLVNVRGRETRNQQISEADLRTRLGALALAIIYRHVDEIPSRTEVVRIISSTMPDLEECRDSNGKLRESGAFLQEVAEATGLLALHSRSSDGSSELVTFMHYSFLEYYAAAGLLQRNYLDEVPTLAGKQRWHDVITLLVGMLSEQADVTPLLKKLVLSDGENDISHYLLFLAIDCAAECEVPPEASQELVASAVYHCVHSGTARYSAELRAELAQRILPFMTGARARFDTIFTKGLSSTDPIASAAFADLIARIDPDIPMSTSVIDAFERCLDHSHPTTRRASLYAMESRSEFRGARALEIINDSLKRSFEEKSAALLLILSIPDYSTSTRARLRELLDDKDGLIRSRAARCLLGDILRSSQSDSPELVHKVLRVLDSATAEDKEMEVGRFSVDKAQISAMLASDKLNDRALAVRFAPWVKDDNQFIYQVLMREFRSANGLKSACLDSLGSARQAIALVTLADTDLVCSSLQGKDRTLRIAAIRFLSKLPGDEQVVSSLRAHIDAEILSPDDADEVFETARALAIHARKNVRLRDEVLGAVISQSTSSMQNGFGDAVKQQHLCAMLNVCDVIGGMADISSSRQLLALGRDFRTPIAIRTAALKVYGRVVEPSLESVKNVVALLTLNDFRLNESVYAAAASFARNCKRKVEYVRRVSPEFENLRAALAGCWDREISGRPKSIDPGWAGDLRSAIVEVRGLMNAYEEFSARAQVRDGGKGDDA